jgi:hypothetical protein
MIRHLQQRIEELAVSNVCIFNLQVKYFKEKLFLISSAGHPERVFRLKRIGTRSRKNSGKTVIQTVIL